MSLAGEVVERHGARLSFRWAPLCCGAACVLAFAVAMRFIAPMGVDLRSRGWRLWPHPVKMAVCDGRLEKGARRPENCLAGGGEVRRR